MSLNLKMSYTQLPVDFYAEALPMKLKTPVLLIENSELFSQLGICIEDFDLHNIFSGEHSFFNPMPIAMAYSGHQFGYLSPNLGDGRALLLGEAVSLDAKRFDIHLKGSGATPYSRRGDGKSTLRGALKEYIFSESLAGLGIPTTRSLAVIKTGETVRRDGIHAGAVLFRTASSHIRVGSFVYASLLNDIDALKSLADYTISREYSEINLANQHRYEMFLEQVISRQAKLIAKWMSVGFIHGVMNTDNMTISGETIDFGPCAFMDSFNENQVYSSIDEGGRYAWNKQPEMALWNLSRFAETLLPLLDENSELAIKKAEAMLGKFMPEHLKHFHEIIASKLGLQSDKASHLELIKKTFVLLQVTRVDYTAFFRELTRVAMGEEITNLAALFQKTELLQSWLDRWTALRNKLSDKEDLTEQMRQTNPIFIPRSYLVEEALENARNEKMESFNQLLQVVQNPYEENYFLNHLSQAAEKWQSQIPTFCET